MNRMNRLFCCVCVLPFIVLASCSSAHNEAPIVDGWKQTSAESNDYRVQKNDTIYSIAWAFAMDYRKLAQANHLQEPFDLHEGQVLRMSSSSSSMSNSRPDNTPATQTSEATPIAQEQSAPIVADATPPSTSPTESKNPTARNKPVKPAKTAKTTKSAKSTTKWLWPTQGSVSNGFSNVSGGNKGVNISGRLSQPIVASASGKVVYTGASLPGYGNLIIIKHSENELSAYAFNKVIGVKEGEVVKAGQVIARMGKNDSGKAMLHFEIRKNGKPVDPMMYLGKKT